MTTNEQHEVMTGQVSGSVDTRALSFAAQSGQSGRKLPVDPTVREYGSALITERGMNTINASFTPLIGHARDFVRRLLPKDIEPLGLGTVKVGAGDGIPTHDLGVIVIANNWKSSTVLLSNRMPSGLYQEIYKNCGSSAGSRKSNALYNAGYVAGHDAGYKAGHSDGFYAIVRTALGADLRQKSSVKSTNLSQRQFGEESGVNPSAKYKAEFDLDTMIFNAITTADILIESNAVQKPELSTAYESGYEAGCSDGYEVGYDTGFYAAVSAALGTELESNALTGT